MAGITLEQAQTQLAAYLAAETAVLGGQEYEIDINGSRRRLKRADLEAIRAGINSWNARVVQLAASASGSSRARSVVPRG